MKKYRGFNFVELMLVMCILGIIITLTMPLLRDIKDDDNIYDAYLQKANQNIVNAMSMSFVRNRFISDLNSLGTVPNYITTAAFLNAADKKSAYRFFFNTSFKGLECGVGSTDPNARIYSDEDDDILPCLTNLDFSTDTEANFALDAALPGIILQGNAAVMFENAKNTDTDGDGNADDAANGILGRIYVDMNGDRGPNAMCSDRYRFILYANRVALDETPTKTNADGTIRTCIIR